MLLHNMVIGSVVYKWFASFTMAFPYLSLAKKRIAFRLTATLWPFKFNHEPSYYNSTTMSGLYYT